MNPRVQVREGRKWLVLSEEDFADGPLRGVIRELGATPHDVMHYDLSGCRLNDREGKELKRLMRAIRKGVRHLDLSTNGLGFSLIRGPEFRKIFMAIPESVTSIDLSGNNINLLGQCSAMLSALHDGLTHLRLAKNSLGFSRDLADVFSAIPQSVTHLDLSQNGLSKENKTCEALQNAFKAIPSGVTDLDLSGNNLASYTDSELSRIFAALPDSVTTLNVSDTGFNRLGQFAVIPAHIKTIQADHFSRMKNANAEKLIAVFSKWLGHEDNVGRRIRIARPFPRFDAAYVSDKSEREAKELLRQIICLGGYEWLHGAMDAFSARTDFYSLLKSEEGDLVMSLYTGSCETDAKALLHLENWLLDAFPESNDTHSLDHEDENNGIPLVGALGKSIGHLLAASRAIFETLPDQQTYYELLDSILRGYLSLGGKPQDIVLNHDWNRDEMEQLHQLQPSEESWIESVCCYALENKREYDAISSIAELDEICNAYEDKLASHRTLTEDTQQKINGIRQLRLHLQGDFKEEKNNAEGKIAYPNDTALSRLERFREAFLEDNSDIKSILGKRRDSHAENFVSTVYQLLGYSGDELSDAVQNRLENLQKNRFFRTEGHRVAQSMENILNQGIRKSK